MNTLQQFKSCFARPAVLFFVMLTMTAQTAWADDSGSCGDNLTWALTDENGDNTKETLTISGTGAMNNFDSPPWYDNRENIKTVVIGNGVTSIGDCAFENCTGLTSIEIPSSVTSIGVGAFWNCPALESITVDQNNTKYDSGNGCNAIIETGIKTLIAGCKNTVIPSSVTSIGDFAFFGCTGLTSITIPASVKSIGQYAFYYCTGLTSITIPSSVTSIGVGAFWNCPALESITVDQNNTKYDSGNGCNAIIETGIKTLIVGCKNTVIPSSVTSIGKYAFFGCSGLTSITIPTSVTSIGDCAFENCTGLTSITIPSSVTSIGDEVFWGCSALTSVIILRSSLTAYGSDVFDKNASGRKIYVLKGSADAYQTGWSKYINDIVEFDGYCGDSNVNGGKNVFWALTDENGDNTKETLTIIGTGPMGDFNLPPDNRENIKTVVIGNGVESIGQHAFYYCTGLTSITIPSSVTSIGQHAFHYCTSLTSITIPSSVTSIGVGAFWDCPALETITVDQNNTKYDSGNGCNAIIETVSNTLVVGCKNTVIPSSVTSIGDYAFEDCTGLTSITIPSSVTSIGVYAFYGCSGLTSITIPSSVTSIGQCAFRECSTLTSVNIPSSVTSIGVRAFWKCSSLTSIDIPSSVESIGEDAFYGCNNVTDVYCYANPDKLIWTDEYCDDFIDSPAKTTVCHVAGSKLATYESKWNKGEDTDVNVTFVGDGFEPGGKAYLVRTVTAGSGTPPDGVKAFLPVDYDLSTATVTLAEVTGAPKVLPVIYGPAAEGEAMPGLFFLKYVADDSDADKAIQSDYADKAKAMNKRFVITDGEQTLAEILTGISDVPANEALFLVLANGKFNTVDVSAADLEKKAKPGQLLFVLSKWEYMHLGSSTNTNPVGPLGTRSIGIGSDDGTATGIEAVQATSLRSGLDGDAWHDLQGRRLSEKPTRKGLYIRNGKKVVVK